MSPCHPGASVSRVLFARTAVVAALVGAMALFAGCNAPVDEDPDAEIGSSAWQVLAERVGPDGEVSLQLALDAFATLVGPIPGGEPVRSPAVGTASGTAAIRWLGRWWPELTEKQREAAGTSLGAPTDPAKGEVRDDLQAFVDAVLAEFRERHAEFDPLPATVHVPMGPRPGNPSWAFVSPGDRDGDPLVSGRPETCRLSFTGAGVGLFEATRDPEEDESSRATALVTLRSITAHELMHCHQMRLAGDATRWTNSPPWIAEGSAEWGGYLFAAPDREIPAGLDAWADFFMLPGTSLLNRKYDAVGFWSHLTAPWQILSIAMALDWENLANKRRNNFRVIAEAQAEYSRTGMPRWAMSFLRRPTLGPKWEFDAPGIGTVGPPEAEAVVLGAGTSHELVSPPLAFGYADLGLEDGVEVVRLEPHAEGAVHWGVDAGGPDDLFAEETGTMWFCVAPGACECPDGTAAVTAVADRDFSEFTVSFFGIHPADIASTSPLRPRVMVSSSALDDVAGELCRDRPAEIDISVCEAYFPDEVLTGTVPSAEPKHVVRGEVLSEQAADTGGNPGATVIFCFWDVVGGSHPDEPFFDWLIHYTFVIHVRGPEPEQDFRRRWDLLAEDSSCSNVELDQSTVACAGTGSTGPTVMSAFDPNLFLLVETSRLDLPEDTVRRAAGQLMLHAIHQFGL